MYINLYLCGIKLLRMEDNRYLNRLKVVLADKKRTNKWLAEQLNKNETTISRWCTNEVQHSMENLVEIAKLLEVDVRELIKPTKK